MPAASELRRQQELLDRMSLRVLQRLQLGQLTQGEADDRLALNARLWTRLENEVAGLEYQEDNVAPTVF